MPNMSQKKVEMPSQEPKVRACNFDEVALGYTAQMAVEEADRCLNCKTPLCVKGCPVGINIPAFIQKVKTGEFEAAYRIITEASSLPAVCGRVCPQEAQCEGKCVRSNKGEAVAPPLFHFILSAGRNISPAHWQPPPHFQGWCRDTGRRSSSNRPRGY